MRIEKVKNAKRIEKRDFDKSGNPYMREHAGEKARITGFVDEGTGKTIFLGDVIRSRVLFDGVPIFEKIAHELKLGKIKEPPLSEDEKPPKNDRERNARLYNPYNQDYYDKLWPEKFVIEKNYGIKLQVEPESDKQTRINAIVKAYALKKLEEFEPDESRRQLFFKIYSQAPAHLGNELTRAYGRQDQETVKFIPQGFLNLISKSGSLRFESSEFKSFSVASPKYQVITHEMIFGMFDGKVKTENTICFPSVFDLDLTKGGWNILSASTDNDFVWAIISGYVIEPRSLWSILTSEQKSSGNELDNDDSAGVEGEAFTVEKNCLYDASGNPKRMVDDDLSGQFIIFKSAMAELKSSVSSSREDQLGEIVKNLIKLITEAVDNRLAMSGQEWAKISKIVSGIRGAVRQEKNSLHSLFTLLKDISKGDFVFQDEDIKKNIGDILNVILGKEDLSYSYKTAVDYLEKYSEIIDSLNRMGAGAKKGKSDFLRVIDLIENIEQDSDKIGVFVFIEQIRKQLVKFKEDIDERAKLNADDGGMQDDDKEPDQNEKDPLVIFEESVTNNNLLESFARQALKLNHNNGYIYRETVLEKPAIVAVKRVIKDLLFIQELDKTSQNDLQGLFSLFHQYLIGAIGIELEALNDKITVIAHSDNQELREIVMSDEMIDFLTEAAIAKTKEPNLSSEDKRSSNDILDLCLRSQLNLLEGEIGAIDEQSSQQDKAAQSYCREVKGALRDTISTKDKRGMIDLTKHVKNGLKSPMDLQNIMKGTTIAKALTHGKRNWRKTVGGIALVVLGSLLAGFGAALIAGGWWTGVALPLGVGLTVLGVSTATAGVALVVSAKERGVKHAGKGLFKECNAHYVDQYKQKGEEERLEDNEAGIVNPASSVN